MEDESLATELLLVSICLRQILVVILRKGGKSSWVHPHEDIAFIPLAWTFVACFLATTELVPSLKPGITEAHIGLVFTPQVLTWFWCLQSRAEIKKSDFTAHCLAMAAVVILLLAGGHFGNMCAVATSMFAFIRRSSFPRSRQCFFWLVTLVLSICRTQHVHENYSNWIVSLGEISMMLVVKFKWAQWFKYDKTVDLSKNSLQQDSDDETTRSVAPDPPLQSQRGPLLSFDSSLEDASSVDSPTNRTQDTLKQDTTSQPRHPGSGHRRELSTQSSGNGWGWGVAVPDFVATSLSPPSSSDEEDDEEGLA